MGKKEVARLSKDFLEKTPIERQLECIDKFYPGVNGLTANEVALFADPDLDTLHKFQLHVALRRINPKWFNDKSKVIGSTKREIEKHFKGGGQT